MLHVFSEAVYSISCDLLVCRPAAQGQANAVQYTAPRDVKRLCLATFLCRFVSTVGHVHRVIYNHAVDVQCTYVWNTVCERVCSHTYLLYVASLRINIAVSNV